MNIRPNNIPDFQTQRAIADIAKRAVEKGLLTDAIEVKNVVLSTTAFTRVPHKLGRKVKGWFVSRVMSTPGAAFAVFDELDQHTDTDRFLYLKSVGSDVTVNVVVF